MMTLRRSHALLPILALLASGLGADPCVVISEIMYHPADPEEALEFVELHNPEAPRADLSDWRIEGEIEYAFPPGTVLLPGEYLVVARAPTHLQKAYALARRPLRFDGRLGNKGGTLRLINSAGRTACAVRYDDRDPWPASADGAGHSLALRDPVFDPRDPASWAQSPAVGGTPAAPNGFGPGPSRVALAPLPAVKINEIACGPGGFIELLNASGDAIPLGGWLVTNDFAALAKYRIPDGVVLTAYGFLTLPAEAFGPGFALAAPDIECAVSLPGGACVVDAVRAGGLAAGTACGRVPDGTGAIAPCGAPTPGAANKPLSVPDLVVSEIMYHPITEDDRDEYLEIYNRSSRTVDLAGCTVRGFGFTFPAKARIGPKSYIVVAKDPARLGARYGIKSTILFGPCQGALSDGGETIRLETPEGVCIDEVTYGDRDPWPAWADGLGESLELVDVEGENDLPAAWGASDSRAGAQWQTFEYAGIHRAFRDMNLSEFQFLLLGAGECLIDNVVLASQDEALVKEGFERGDFGWSALGTHDRSAVTDAAAAGKGAYLIVADGRGDPRHNYVSVTVRRSLVPDKRYFLRFRAKWQRGAVQLLTRTIGQGVARTHTLSPPRKLGTPGAPNGIAASGGAPIVGVPAQTPIAPDDKTPVAVRVRIDARDAPAGADICYRRDGETAWKKAPLAPCGLPARRGSALWSGAIPAQAAGLVEFYIEARSAAGAARRYPADAPARTACYLVGLTCHERLPTYHLLAPKAQWDALKARPRLSNRPADATFVYGNAAIFYNVAFRARGSPYTRDMSFNWRIRFGERRLGGRNAYTLDGQKQDGTRQHERAVHWLLANLRVPSLRQRYVFVNIPGREQGVFEDVERVDGEFIDRWFPGQERGNLHKIDDYFELLPGRGAEQQRVEADFKWQGPDPELYRWNFAPRATGTIEDFGPLLRLIALMDPEATKTGFMPQFEKAANADQWLRTFAVRTICDDWDTMGRGRGKNAYVYRTPGKDGLWHLLVWDSDLTFRNVQSPLFPDKFASFKRLLAEPFYRRQFLSYLGYMARGPFLQDLPVILGDTSKACGGDAASILRFAQARSAFVLSQIPEGPRFAVEQARRVSRQGKPDVVQAAGKAPTLAGRFTLDGRPGAHRFLDAERWTAEFPVGPEGGVMTLAAEDLGGGAIASQGVRISARQSAVALAPAEPQTPEPQYVPRPAPPAPIELALASGRKEPPAVAAQTPPPVETPRVDVEAPHPAFADGEALLNVDAEETTAPAAEEEQPARRTPPPAPAAAPIAPSVPDTSRETDVAMVAREREPPPHRTAAPEEPAQRAPVAGAGPGKALWYFVAGALLCLALLGALVAGVYRQLRKLGAPAGARDGVAADRAAGAPHKAAAIPKDIKPPAPPPRRPPPPVQHPAPRQPPARQAPPPPRRPPQSLPPQPSAAPAAQAADHGEAAALIAQLAGADYQSAARAFSRLARMGAAALPALAAERRPGSTPFGKIRRGPAGLTPAPAGEHAPLPVQAVVDLLIAAARAKP
ncbi:MAG TPA: hypothetical protein DCM87_05665 [Planctomycetes bacterium]|nr:hypothetical protein [Planctomycetota bacterium]